MIVYFALILVVPYINDALITMQKKQFQGLILVLFGICCVYGFVFDSSYIGTNNGYSFLFAMFLYIIGRYVKIYNIENRVKSYNSIIVYVGSALINIGGILLLLILGKSNIAWRLFSYNNPLVLIQSIAFIVFFLGIKCEGKLSSFIGRYGGNTLGVYVTLSFKQAWSNYPGAVDVWVRNWQYVAQLFNYGSAVRKVMYTTNAIESVNSSFRKVTKKGAFPGETAILKLLYLRITELYKKWNNRPIANWALVRNQLAIDDSIQARILKYENF